MRFRPDENRPASIDVATDVYKQKFILDALLQIFGFGAGALSTISRWIAQDSYPILSEQFHALQSKSPLFHEWIYSFPDFGAMMSVNVFFMQCTTLISWWLHTVEDDSFSKENNNGYSKEHFFNDRKRLHELRILCIEIGEVLTQLAWVAAFSWNYLSIEMEQLLGTKKGVFEENDIRWFIRVAVILSVYIVLQKLSLYGFALHKKNDNKKI